MHNEEEEARMRLFDVEQRLAAANQRRDTVMRHLVAANASLTHIADKLEVLKKIKILKSIFFLF